MGRLRSSGKNPIPRAHDAAAQHDRYDAGLANESARLVVVEDGAGEPGLIGVELVRRDCAGR
jgi:hypothetical protein